MIPEALAWLAIAVELVACVFEATGHLMVGLTLVWVTVVLLWLVIGFLRPWDRS